jgi:hypothetical protein
VASIRGDGLRPSRCLREWFRDIWAELGLCRSNRWFRRFGVAEASIRGHGSRSVPRARVIASRSGREFGWVRREDGGRLAPEVRKSWLAVWLRKEVVAPACTTRTFELTGIRVLE